MGKNKPFHQPLLTMLALWWCSAYCFLSNLHLLLVVAKCWYSHLLFWLNKISGFTTPYPSLATGQAAALRILLKCLAKPCIHTPLQSKWAIWIRCTPCIHTPLQSKWAIWSHCTWLCSKGETLGKRALGKEELWVFPCMGEFFYKRKDSGHCLGGPLPLRRYPCIEMEYRSIFSSLVK